MCREVTSMVRVRCPNTLLWTAGSRKKRSFPDRLANGSSPAFCCPSPSVPVREIVPCQSPAMPPTAMPVTLPEASKPNMRLVASPRGKTNLTVAKL